jgi:hypothetical protein
VVEDAEILMLRHQLAVALRERPRAHSRLTWPDRAWLALLAGTLPAGRLAELRLIVTPVTILRWHRDIARELFDRLLIVNEHHLRQVLIEYLRHYNTARPHRALGQLVPAQAHARPPQINLAEHRIGRKQVLGGLTHEYRIAA